MFKIYELTDNGWEFRREVATLKDFDETAITVPTQVEEDNDTGVVSIVGTYYPSTIDTSM